MFKVILILAAIALLALSAELSRARSDPLSLESDQVADLGFTGGEEGAGSTGLAILSWRRQAARLMRLCLRQSGYHRQRPRDPPAAKTIGQRPRCCCMAP